MKSNVSHNGEFSPRRRSFALHFSDGSQNLFIFFHNFINDNDNILHVYTFITSKNVRRKMIMVAFDLTTCHDIYDQRWKITIRLVSKALQKPGNIFPDLSASPCIFPERQSDTKFMGSSEAASLTRRTTKSVPETFHVTAPTDDLALARTP